MFIASEMVSTLLRQIKTTENYIQASPDKTFTAKLT